MSSPVIRFKELLSEAAYDAGAHWGSFRRTYHADEFFEGVLQERETPGEIAARALCHLCLGDDGFNGNTIGLKAVVRFLAVYSNDAPENLGDTADCLGSLKRVLDADCGYESVRTWVREWYRV